MYCTHVVCIYWLCFPIEADKTRLSLPAEEEAQRVVTDFALQVWNQADLEDQNGMG